MSGVEEPAGWGNNPTAPAISSLVAENALLKRTLRIPTDQRVLEEVMSRAVNALLREAVQKVAHRDNQVGVVVPGVAAGDSEDGSGARQTLSDVLAALTAEKEASDTHLASVLANTVTPLQEQVARLEAERAALRARVGELEATVSNQSPPAFMAELESLRKGEVLYREQLASMQNEEEGAVAKVNAMMAEGLAATRALPEYAETIESLKEALRGSRATQQYLALELEEQASRAALLEKLRESVAQDAQARVEEKAQLLEAQLHDAAAREEGLKSEKQDLEEQVRVLREENVRLSTQSNSAVDVAAVKRQRVEEESASTHHPPSVRRDFIQFWYDGQDKIRDLERQVSELKRAAADLRVAQGRVAQLERSRETTLGQLTLVAQEVIKIREENQKQRAQVAGLEVERDHLLRVVASTVEGHMSATELQDCCRAIREAARAQAAASAAVVTDPEALQQAVRRAHELKNEVAVLQRQKDKLTHYLGIQEDRVLTLTEKRALLTVGHPHKAGAAATSSEVPTPHPLLAKMTLPQFLEIVVSSAKDILWESEMAAIGLLDDRSALEAAMSRHRNAFVDVQGRLLDTQSSLLASQQSLQEALRDNTAIEARMEQTQRDLTAMIEAKDAAMRALEKTNATLLQHASVTGGQNRELRRQLDGMTGFADHMLKALGGVFALFQSEVAHVDSLRKLIAAERKGMMELVRQGSSGSSFDVATVTDGLRQLGNSIQTAVDENKLRNEETRTDFLKKLVGLLRQQEQQVASMQKDFMVASQAQAASVAQRVAAAQKEWESAWRKRCEAAEAQRDQLSAIGLSSRALHQALEGATAKMPEADKPPSLSPSLSANEATAEPSPTARTTLAAIDEFIERARQQLAARSAAPAPSPAPIPAPQPVAPDPAPALPVPVPVTQQEGAEPHPTAEEEEGMGGGQEPNRDGPAEGSPDKGIEEEGEPQDTGSGGEQSQPE